MLSSKYHNQKSISHKRSQLLVVGMRISNLCAPSGERPQPKKTSVGKKSCHKTRQDIQLHKNRDRYNNREHLELLILPEITHGCSKIRREIDFDIRVRDVGIVKVKPTEQTPDQCQNRTHPEDAHRPDAGKSAFLLGSSDECLRNTRERQRQALPIHPGPAHHHIDRQSAKQNERNQRAPHDQ